MPAKYIPLLDGPENLPPSTLVANRPAVLTEHVPMPPVVADGDILFAQGGEWKRKPRGANGKVLSMVGGLPDWAAGSSPPAPSITQFVSVAKWGNDANTGGVTDPFLTIAAAVNSILDAGPTKTYGVLIGPGVYTETIKDLIRPNIYLLGVNYGPMQIGTKPYGVIIGTDDNSAVIVTPGSNGYGATNIRFLVDVDISAVGLAGSSVFTWENCSFGADFIQSTGNGNIDCIFNNCLIDNQSLRVKAGDFVLNGSNINDIEIVVLGPTSIQSNYSIIGSCFADTSVATWRYQVSLVGSDAFQGGASLADTGLNGACSLIYDVLTYAVDPTNYVGAGVAATQTGSMDAARGFYKPTTAANWGATVPTTVKQALDLIAAKIAPVS